MALSDSLLPEYDHEMAITRRILDLVPVDKFDWKPHPKSFSLKALASHIAEIPGWTEGTLTQDSFDFAPVGGPPYTPPPVESRADLLAVFDKGVAEGRSALAVVTDETMAKPWSLMSGGHVLFTMPKAAVIRGFIMSHIIHHRAQLGVYLRMHEVPLPSTYGPSADENKF